MHRYSKLSSESQIFKLADNQNVSYVDTQGGKKTLVFIHGMGSSLDCWAKLIKPLRENYRCVLLDLPGYGQSTPFSDPFTLGSCIKVVTRLLTHLDISELTLVAHSMGGQIGILFAQQTAFKLNELVLISPAGLEQFDKNDLSWVEENITVDSLLQMDKSAVAKLVRKNFYDPELDIEILVRQRLAQMNDPILYAQYCKTIVESYKTMLKEKTTLANTKISIPVLIFFGLKDYYIPHRIMHKGLSLDKVIEMGDVLFSDCQNLILNDCGHFPQWEKPEKILEHFYNKTIVNINNNSF